MHEERTASLGADPHPPSRAAMAFPLLESFHPRRSSRLADTTKLTRREVSHFMATTIVAKEDGSEKKKRGVWRKGLNTPRPLVASLYSQRRCTVSSSGPSDQPSAATKDPWESARHPFNPRSMPLGGCMMMVM